MAYTCRGEAVRERDGLREVGCISFARPGCVGVGEPGGETARGRARVVRSGMELQVVINEAESSLLPIGEETPGIPVEF